MRVDLVPCGPHHHLIENKLVRAMIWLKNCWIGDKQKSLKQTQKNNNFKYCLLPAQNKLIQLEPTFQDKRVSETNQNFYNLNSFAVLFVMLYFHILPVKYRNKQYNGKKSCNFYWNHEPHKKTRGGVKSADKMDIDQMHIDVIIVRRIWGLHLILRNH
jgi:hypothetical protein